MKTYPLPEEKGRMSSKKVSEVVTEYITRGTSQNKLTWVILGGENFLKKQPSSLIEYVCIGQKGIPKSSVIYLADFMNLPLKDIAHLLNISYKTLGRKHPQDKMDALSSSMSIEIASVVAQGMLVFEEAEKFNSWLHKSNIALEGKTPFDLLNTPTGINIIKKLLIRIEEGVYT